MIQYVIQIQVAENGLGIGWLAKSFKVSVEIPIPTEWPSNRVQIIMTNMTSFNAIVAVYNQYTTTVFFSYDQSAGTISCTGAVTNSWPID